MPVQRHVENTVVLGVVNVRCNEREKVKESPDRDFSSGLSYWGLDVYSF